MGPRLRIFLGGRNTALCKEIASLQNSQNEQGKMISPPSLLTSSAKFFLPASTALYFTSKKIVFQTKGLGMSVITHHVTILVSVLAVIKLLFFLIFEKLDVKSG